MQELINKGKELFAAGTVDRIIGWTRGELPYDREVKIFTSAESFEKGFVYDCFCGANLSKYLIAESGKEGKIGVFLKPCDSYSFAQLVKEHRIKKENTYTVAIECYGKCDAKALADSVEDAIYWITDNGAELKVSTVAGDVVRRTYDYQLEKCASCKTKKHAPVYDEIIGAEGEKVDDCNRFDMVAKLEAMTPEERFAFWRGELSRCIRCNACRNVCPACSCENCVFDNPASGISQKAAADSFEENNFHIIRAFHVAGRCTDCGECSRVCPQHIPLHLLNRKFIKDINELYGEYQAGENADERAPLTNYKQNDCEPSVVYERGGKN